MFCSRVPYLESLESGEQLDVLHQLTMCALIVFSQGAVCLEGLQGRIRNGGWTAPHLPCRIPRPRPLMLLAHRSSS